MLFLLFGGGTRLKQMGTGEQHTCPRCHNTTTWQRVRRCNELTFFFVPIARWSRRDLEACPICGESREISLPSSKRRLRLHRHATA